MVNKIFLTCVLIVVGLCAFTHSAQRSYAQAATEPSESRVALVIGNARYASVPPLADPERDSKAVAAVFADLGFTNIMLESDLTRDRFISRLRTFSRLAEHADWAVIYYAGHGMAAGGDDFLVPVDARLLSDVDIDDEAISLRRLIAATAKATKVRLVIVDASRDNPFLASMTREVNDKDDAIGLAAPSPGGGVAVVFSAKAGQFAREGGQFDNSPFVTSLIKTLRKPGLDLDALFRRTRNEVIVATAGTQEPALYGSLPKAILRSNAPAADDDVAWESLGRSVDQELLTRFTSQFPKSPWSAAAYGRLAELERKLVITDAVAADDQSAADPDAKSGAPLTISCGTPGVELIFCEREVGIWSKRTGVKVEVVPAPGPMDDRLGLYESTLERHSPELDIVQIDVTWSGMLADHLVDLYGYSGGVEKEILPVVLDAAVVDGRLVAMPWFVNSGLLFYRKDLLAKYGLDVPQTWEELDQSAAVIQKGERSEGAEKFYGFLFNGRATEGLTCFALEMINAYGGAVERVDNGHLSIDATATEQALKTVTNWVGKISPPDVIDYNEESVRQEFQNGNAAFMRNWPYVLYLAEEKSSALRGKVGVAPLPRGGTMGNRTGVLGGWQLAVSKYSRHRKQAVALVMFLTSVQVQKERAIEGGYAPAIGALYSDPNVLASNVMFHDMFTAVTNSIVRPSRILGAKYDEFTTTLREEVERALRGQQTPKAAAEAINARL